MKRSTVILILIIIVLAFFAAMYFFNPRIVNVTEEVVKIDTLYFTMKETLPPDTVYQYRTMVVKDTVTVLNGDPDEVVVIGDSRPKEGRPEFPSWEGVGVGAPAPMYYQSVKHFNTKFLIGRVDAWAKCRVDSFTVETHLDREAFAKFYGKEIKPDNTAWYYYVGAGILAGGLTIAMIK